MAKSDLAQQFLDLFLTDNGYKYIRKLNADGEYYTYFVDTPVSNGEIKAHLNGDGNAIILNPLFTDGTLKWICVDIDNHSCKRWIDPFVVSTKLTKKFRNLFCFQSKSGGVHVFAFFDEPTEIRLAIVESMTIAKSVKSFGDQVGVDEIDLIPDNSTRHKNDDGSPIKRTGVCLPCFGGVNVAYFNGEEIGSIEEFVSLAWMHKYKLPANSQVKDKMRSSPDDFSSRHQDAPPCLLSLAESRGVGTGGRNEVMYNFGVYSAKRGDKTADNALEFNSLAFDPPLKSREVLSVIKSTARNSSYKYKCHGVCADVCNPTLCSTRKYGITPSKVKRDDSGKVSVEQSIFNELRKIESDPPRWELIVNGMSVIVPVEVLLEFSKLRGHIMNKLTIFVPSMKISDWERELERLFESTILIQEAPDSISIKSQLESYLVDYLIGRFDRTRPCYEEKHFQNQPEMLASLRIGQGILYMINKEEHIIFSGKKFFEWLNLQKIPKALSTYSDVWTLMSNDLGVTFADITLDNKQIGVFCVKKDEYLPKFKLIESGSSNNQKSGDWKWS